MSNSLMTVNYVDSEKNIFLTNYADTVVFDTSGGKPTLCAIRFGGYPEQVGGMMQAIHGGGAVELVTPEKAIILESLVKQYKRKISHDGVYAEATLTAEDEIQQTDEQTENPKKEEALDGEQIELDLPPRNSFIYVNAGDTRALYDAIDRKTGVPMLPEFADYIIEELKKKKFLKPLTVIGSSLKLEAWVLKCTGGDKNIVKIVEKGIKEGEISIPGQRDAAPDVAHGAGRGGFDIITSITEYLSAYGPQIAERIKNLFIPLFDPSTDDVSPEVMEVNRTIQEKAGYSLYDAQLAVAEAIKRQLSRSKAGLIIAECGAGKTKIGSAAIAASVAGLQSDQQRRGKSKTFNIVLCPSHIKEKWVREIEESLPNTFAGVVNNITELNKLYETYAKRRKNCYAIISKEMARDGYMHMPAVAWRKSKGGFVCPDCDAVVQMAISKDGVRYVVDADQFFFRRQNGANHKCESCGSPLWTAVNPTAARKSEWVKLGDYGFVFAPQAERHLRKVKNAEVYEKLSQIIDDPGSVSTAKGAHRKYPLSTYIKKQYKGRIDGLIVDELHQYNNDSGQGDAMAELFQTAKKVVGMTGTLINGYASGIFYLLFRIMPGLMLEDGQKHSKPADFVSEYGVVEIISEIGEGDYSSNRRTLKRKKNTRQLPGVSPLVYSRFLLEYAAFLSLSDMGKDLPDYEEIPIPLTMPEYVEKPYTKMQTALSRFLKNDRKAAQKILSAYLNLLTAYPDQPYSQPPILHPLDGYPIVEPPNVADFDTVMPKDEAVLDIVRRKCEAGERVLNYTNWTRLDTQKKLEKLLTAAGYRTTVLPAKVKPEKRERWVDDCVRKGVQVLITNPSLVETGLDLIPFTTLIFYDTGYKLFTLRQASRRSWRINQNYPRIEVYMLYYVDTMQHKAIKLMANKLAVAGIIEGGFSEEGLAAMSQCDDMTSQMAKELMLGIKDSVEDVSAAFKRMALVKRKVAALNSNVLFTDAPVEIGALKESKTQIVEFTYTPPVIAAPHDRKTPVVFLPDTSEKRKKQPVYDENQLTFFESIA